MIKSNDNKNKDKHIENNEGINQWWEMYECEKFIFGLILIFNPRLSTSL